MIPLLLSLLFQPVQPIYLHFEPVAQYSTPLRELRKTHKVEYGLVCWYPLEVRCIDNVCGETPKSYWEVLVNGDTRYHNANSKLQPGDKVEWKYVRK